MKLLDRFAKKPIGVRIALKSLLVTLIGFLDHATGAEISFSIFYSIPVAMTAWIDGKRAGIFVSLICGGVWLAVDLNTGREYTQSWIPFWNATVRMGFFGIIAIALSRLNLSQVKERALGLQMNARNAELQASLERSQMNLQAAAKVQQACLPKEAGDRNGVRFAWAYLPCEELGGDIFDILEPDADHVAPYVLDVSGHGVPAALLAVTVSRLLSHTSSRATLISEPVAMGGIRAATPAEVVARLNQFHRFPATKQFFTMLYALYHRPSHTLRLTCAGHPKPLVQERRTGEIQEVGSTNIAVGLMSDFSFKEETLKLQPGDRVFFYTDGLLEAMNPDKALFGVRGIKGAIAAASEMSLQEAVDKVTRQAFDWRAGRMAADDITLLGMEVTA